MLSIKNREALVRFLAVMTTVVTIVFFFSIIYENTRFIEMVTQNYENDQLILVQSVSKEIKNNLEHGTSDKIVVPIILNSQVQSASRKWFVYKNENSFYQGRDLQDENKKGQTLIDHVNLWRQNGGEGLDKFLEIVSIEKPESCLVTRNASTGKEIISLVQIKVHETRYLIGLATSQKYMLSMSGYNRHSMRVIIICTVPLVIIIVLTIFFCIYAMRSFRFKSALKDEIVHKNKQIQILEDTIDDDHRLIEVASISDNLTRVYNRRFFDVIVAKMNHKDAAILPLSIVTVDIDGLNLINQCYGYHVGDNLLADLSKILEEKALDTDVIARTGNSEFTIIMASTTEEEAYERIRDITKGFEESIHEARCTLTYGVASKNSENPDIYTLIEKAISNTQIAKLLKPLSHRYEMIQLIKNGLLERSNETQAHSERMGYLSVKVGKLLKMSEPDLIELEIAALLHDMGKIAIPDHILTKSGPLDVKEQRIMQQHPIIGARIARAIPDFSNIATIIEQHHERYNGEGYPYHLKGKQIHIMARIITVVDSYDAMTSNRVYSSAKSGEMARAELIRCSGGHYDPEIICLFLQVLDNE